MSYIECYTKGFSISIQFVYCCNGRHRTGVANMGEGKLHKNRRAGMAQTKARGVQ